MTVGDICLDSIEAGLLLKSSRPVVQLGTLCTSDVPSPDQNTAMSTFWSEPGRPIGDARNFHLAAIVQRVWGTPSGVQSRNPGKRSGGPRNRSSLQTLFTDCDCRNDKKLNISHNSPCYYLDQYVPRWEATFWGLSFPGPRVVPPLGRP